jgi:hypothetical protein
MKQKEKKKRENDEEEKKENEKQQKKEFYKGVFPFHNNSYLLHNLSQNGISLITMDNNAK